MLIDPVHIQTVAVTAPIPPPSEFGPPQTIISPNPYVIGPGAQIHTDPTIVANGVTNYGTIFRDTATDGARSAWMFGSTGPFDTLSGFDSSSGPLNQVATFKFQNLSLGTDPLVSAGNGGPMKLALIGVDGISSTAPGGSFTFGGLLVVLLATVNGPIQPGSEIAFQNIQALFLYARGSNGNLSLNSAVAGTTSLTLAAQGSMTIGGNISTREFMATTGGDYLGGNGSITAKDLQIATGGNLFLDASRIAEWSSGNGSLELTAAGTLTFHAANYSTARDVTAGWGNDRF